MCLPGAWFRCFYYYFAHHIIKIVIVDVGEEARSKNVACTISATNISNFQMARVRFKFNDFVLIFFFSFTARTTKTRKRPWITLIKCQQYVKIFCCFAMDQTK